MADTNDLRLLTPERLEEIRAELVELIVRLNHYAEHWPTTYDSDRKARKLFADAALAIRTLTTQRDHYHTEWTARGTALWQLHQDIDALKAKAAFTPDDVRVLEMAEYRYGFCPKTESCGGCDRCNADWDLFLAIRPRLAALTLITPTP